MIKPDRATTMMGVQVTILPSQFPARQREDLYRSLRHKRIENKQHYETVKQVQKWVALHKAYSPSRTRPDCEALFNHCFEAACCSAVSGRYVHVVGLGSGDGTKEQRFIHMLKESGREVFYSPVDVGLPMVLEARETALKEITADRCAPIICDLANEPALLAALDEVLSTLGSLPKEVIRVFTFFGMLPGFSPSEILPRLHTLLRREEGVLLSANLIPPPGLEAMRSQVLPLYDNYLTKAWLLTFLQDLGVDTTPGQAEFVVEEDKLEPGLLRIAAYFKFNSECEITVNDMTAGFAAGDAIRLFQSYRYTLGQLQTTLLRYGFTIRQRWVTEAQDEAVLLVTSAGLGR